jgi:hypothetical protein
MKCSFFFIFVSLAAHCLSAAIIDKRINRIIQEQPNQRCKVWLFFNKSANLSDSSVLFRINDNLKKNGFSRKHLSKWLNALSGYADYRSIEKISKWPNIKKINLVNKFHEKRSKKLRKTRFTEPTKHPLYGYSYDELKLIRVPEAHQLNQIGINKAGKGIRIAVLDAGFNLNHEVFSHFDSTTVLGKRDYVAGILDTSIEYDTTLESDTNESKSEEEHGTNILSIIAAYKKGEMMGIAPFASFILAKTEQVYAKKYSTHTYTDTLGNEYTDTLYYWSEIETIAEEDNWIAAIEWAVDDMNADIVTSSLGYRDDFTDGREPYTIKELDGNTIPITLAADIAVQKGAIVLTSVGNEGNDIALGPTLTAPSDGKYVIGVGSVDANGILANSSSVGPTGDGRKKPDILGPGHLITIATGDNNFYKYYATGTSFATPMAAGVCALYLQYLITENINYTSTQIINNIKLLSFYPPCIDSKSYGYGFGIIDAYGLISGEKKKVRECNEGAISFIAYPQPARNNYLYFQVETDNLTPSNYRENILEVILYTLSGHLVFYGKEAEADIGSTTKFSWNLRTENGEKVSTGIYLIKAKFGNQVWHKKIAIIR